MADEKADIDSQWWAAVRAEGRKTAQVRHHLYDRAACRNRTDDLFNNRCEEWKP